MIDRLLDLARSAVGLHAGQEEFRALIAPGEVHRGAEFERLSTCALFLRGLLAKWIGAERAGHDTTDLIVNAACKACGCGAMFLNHRPCVPLHLWAPYRNGMAMADLVQVHRDAGAAWQWNNVPGGVPAHLLVSRGTILIVGTGGREHALLVESIERDGWPDGSIEYTAIEAGQVDEHGRQCVRQRQHEITPDGLDHVLSVLDDDGFYQDVSNPMPRPVTYIFDPSALVK